MILQLRCRTLCAFSLLCLLSSSVAVRPGGSGLSQTAAAEDGAQDLFAAAVRTTAALTPDEERAAFRLPPGFQIQLVAAEPDIAKPMNLAFDVRGRLWVSSSREYPFAAPAGQTPRDSIRILEDTNGDHRADRVTTFADQLNIPMGLLPCRDGVICFSIPDIIFLRDTDGDGKADTREVLYGPFDTSRDTHGMCNAFRRGPDGWIYACHGFNNRSEVSGRDGNRVALFSGSTFRFRPDGSRIELYTTGQVNPFGMAFDQYGDIFTADCHTRPVTLLLQGGFYESFGRPHDGLGYVPGVMDHLHGSTAIAGIAPGADTSFPDEYQQSSFGGNVMTSRINRNRLVRSGGSVRAVEEPDLLSTTDPWFRPVDLVAGPDGALYVADFYNRIIGHYEVDLYHPGRDRDRGRIWRISWSDVSPTAGDPAAEAAGKAATSERASTDVSLLSPADLVQRLPTALPQQARLIADQLADVHGSSAASALREAVTADSPVLRCRVLQLLHRLRAVDDDLMRQAVADPDERVRVQAYRTLMDVSSDGSGPAAGPGATGTESAAISAELVRELLLQGLGDSDGLVRRVAVQASSRHPSQPLIRPLLALFHATPTDDVHLRHCVRMALRDHLQHEEWLRDLGDIRAAADVLLVAAICPALRSATAAEFVAGNLPVIAAAMPDRLPELLQSMAGSASEKSVEQTIDYVRSAHAADPDLQIRLLESLNAGFAARGRVAPASAVLWAQKIALQLLGMSAADDGAALERLRNSSSEGSAQRIRAATLVGAYQLADLRPALQQLLQSNAVNREEIAVVAGAMVRLDPDSRLAAVAALPLVAGVSDAVVARVRDAVVRHDSAVAGELLEAAVVAATGVEQLRLAEQLAGDVTGADLLVTLVERGRASPQLLLRPSVQQRLSAVSTADLRARTTAVTAGLPADDGPPELVLRQRRDRCRAEPGSATAGTAVFLRHCAVCHQVSGQGKKVGPNLDGIGGRGIDRIVEDLLAPNRNVDVAFRTVTVVTAGGQAVSGLLRELEHERVSLIDSQGRETQLAAGDIEERIPSVLSPMPANLLDILSDEQFRDLMAYLISLRE